MTLFLIIIGFVGGYAASIYTWAWIRTTFTGVETEIASLKARLASLTGAVKAL